MSNDLQQLIDLRQKEISERLFHLHRKQELLFLNRMRLMQRKLKLKVQLQELKSKGFLK
jgi:hypothetical protein